MFSSYLVARGLVTGLPTSEILITYATPPHNANPWGWGWRVGERDECSVKLGTLRNSLVLFATGVRKKRTKQWNLTACAMYTVNGHLWVKE